MVYNVCLWMNELTLKSGLSMEYTQQEKVTQRPVEHEKNTAGPNLDHMLRPEQIIW